MPQVKLLTAANKKDLPAIYSQEHNPDPLVVVKWFSPYSGWRWYATEGEEVQNGACILTGQNGENPDDCTTHYHEVDWRFFGLVTGQYDEMGYWMLSDLDVKRGQLPLVERDLYWTPTPLSKIRSGEVT
jgi:hypothetical protein